MMHFFEKMERDIDFQNEYEKLEQLVLNENYPSTLEYGLRENFLYWRERGNYTSLNELRAKMGFSYIEEDDEYIFVKDIDMGMVLV